jgi:hypothetical protein
MASKLSMTVESLLIAPPTDESADSSGQKASNRVLYVSMHMKQKVREVFSMQAGLQMQITTQRIHHVLGSGADADSGMAHLVTFIHSFTTYPSCIS